MLVVQMLAVSNEVEIKTESEDSESSCTYTPPQFEEETITIKTGIMGDYVRW